MNLSHAHQLIVDDDISFMAAPTCRSTACQLGRTTELEAGAGVLMTNAEVGSIRLASSSRFVTFRRYRVRRSRRSSLISTPPWRDASIPAENPALKLLVGYLESAPGNAHALTTPELQHAVVTHIYDLMAVALGATRDARVNWHMAAACAPARLRYTAKAFIVHNICRQDLSAGSVAAHLGFTPRYVHMLFETEAFSLTKFMIDQRLQHSYRMLLDPRMAERTISAIAFAAGFNDLSHFNRVFRQHFGKTPTDVRAGKKRIS